MKMDLVLQFLPMQVESPHCGVCGDRLGLHAPGWHVFTGAKGLVCRDCVYKHAPELIPARGAANALMDALDAADMARCVTETPPPDLARELGGGAG
jgi:hypothetical protein